MINNGPNPVSFDVYTSEGPGNFALNQTVQPYSQNFYQTNANASYRLVVQAGSDPTVSVWAGGTEGGGAGSTDWLGDDISQNEGTLGRAFFLPGQTQGATIFADTDGTVLTVNGLNYMLDRGDYITVPGGVNYRITSNFPVMMQVTGGNGLNDWAAQLKQFGSPDTDGDGISNACEPAGPVAFSDNFTTAAGVPLPFVLRADPAVPTTWTIVDGPQDGSLSGPAPTLTYTPDPGFSGQDWIVFTVTAGGITSAPATVGFFVDGPPVGVADTYSFAEDSGTFTQLAPGVLANDSDPQNDPLTAVLVSGPTVGMGTINADGSISYTPPLNFNGPVTMVYRVEANGLASADTTVTINVTPTNDPPVAVDDSYTVDEDTTLTVVSANGVLDNDNDVDGDSLSVQVAGTTGPSNGVLNILPSGAFDYTPNPNFNGTDSFQYTMTDGTVTDTATVTITVNSVEDIPVANPDGYNVLEDGVLTVAAPACSTMTPTETGIRSSRPS